MSRFAWSTVFPLALVSLTAQASVPTEPPTFTSPLTITNRYQPFQIGGFKRFLGVEDGKRLDASEVYLSETRQFHWSGTDVQTRILMEIAIEDGHLAEITRTFVAQADDGTLYSFGALVDEYEDDAVTGHDGSWLVGGATLASDPIDTYVATNPTIVMPANPELGDRFETEDDGEDANETDTVRAVHRTITVPAGAYDDVIGIVETTRFDVYRQRMAFAPGVGLVRVTKGDDWLELMTSTLRFPNAR